MLAFILAALVIARILIIVKVKSKPSYLKIFFALVPTSTAATISLVFSIGFFPYIAMLFSESFNKISAATTVTTF